MKTLHKVLIVDDHPLFRKGLEQILNSVPSLNVVGQAGSANEALRLANALKPDLVSMDLSLPDQSGFICMKELLCSLPGIAILVISMHKQTDFVLRAFQNFARGYLLKESAGDRLIEAVTTVLQGKVYLDPALPERIALKLQDSDAFAELSTPEDNRLSPRELEVLRLIAEGLPAKNLAAKLNISQKTVESHRANIMRKQGLSNTIDMVRLAVNLGLIDLETWKM